MWLDLTTSHRQTWLFSSASTYHSTDLLTARGVAHLVVHGTSGSCRYETIPPVRLESSGGVLSTVDMVMQRRDGPRRLRVVIPSTRRTTLGDRAFPMTAARAWNSLPSSVRSAPSLLQFRRDLKTALFQSSYSSLFGCVTDCNCNL